MVPKFVGIYAPACHMVESECARWVGGKKLVDVRAIRLRASSTSLCTRVCVRIEGRACPLPDECVLRVQDASMPSLITIYKLAVNGGS